MANFYKRWEVPFDNEIEVLKDGQDSMVKVSASNKKTRGSHDVRLSAEQAVELGEYLIRMGSICPCCGKEA